MVACAQVLLVSWLPTGQYGSCMPRLGSTKIMDTVILEDYLITRRGPLPALIPVAGNYSTRRISLCVADMLDRKEINALNYRTKAVYVSSRKEITGVNSLHHCACTPRVSNRHFWYSYPTYLALTHDLW